MRRTLRLTLLSLAVLTVVVALSGCGGSDADADPQEVLDNALGGGTGVESGVLDLTLDVESTGDQPGSINASVKGPFQSGGTDAMPQADLDVIASIDSGAAGGNLDIDGGLTLTEDGAWVGLDDQEYQLDDTTFQAVQTSYEQSAASQDSSDQGSLQQFGIDPESWVADLTNEGTEDLDGTEVVHVSGSADVPKIISDLNDVAQQTGQAQQLDPGSLSDLEDTVSDATIDVYAATDDDSLRKFEVHLTLADPRGGSGEVTVDLSAGITDPDGDQTITAPTDAQPLSVLLSQLGGGVPQQASGAANKYYDCVAKAKDAQAVDACAAQISG